MKVFPNVWTGCLLAFVLAGFSNGHAQAAPTSQDATRPSIPSTIVAANGKIYQTVRLLRVEPDGLYVEFSPAGGGIGLGKIKFRDLPEALRQQFGYDPDKARDYEIERGKSGAQWRTDLLKAQEEAAQKLPEQAMPEPPNEPPAGAGLFSGRFQVSATIAGAMILDTVTGEAWLADLHSTLQYPDLTEFLLPKVDLTQMQAAAHAQSRGFARGY
jgi:hypothetical protein